MWNSLKSPYSDLYTLFLDFNGYLGLFYRKYMTFLLLLMPAASLPLIISIISLHHCLEKPSIISKAGNLLNWIRPRSGPKNPLLPREARTTYSQCIFCLFVCFLGNPCHEISTYFSCVTQCWAYTKHSVSLHLIDLTQSEVFQSPNLGYSINWLGGPGQIIYTSRIFIASLIH